MVYIIAASNKIYEPLVDRLSKRLPGDFILINRKEQLDREMLRQYNPKYIFFPHWSHLIPGEIYNQFECIIFHMTDVPFGRGGSPLQNLVVRGISETMISAIKCDQEIDGGPVYIKRPLSLHGTAEEIFLRAVREIEEMIVTIVENEPAPVPQAGEAVLFKRRKPEDGNIAHLSGLEDVFDYIRMLDAEGYPPAFLEHGNFVFEFSRASLKNGYLLADVKISRKKKDENEQ